MHVVSFPNSFASIYYIIKPMLRSESNISKYQGTELTLNPEQFGPQGFLSSLVYTTRAFWMVSRETGHEEMDHRISNILKGLSR